MRGKRFGLFTHTKHPLQSYELGSLPFNSHLIRLECWNHLKLLELLDFPRFFSQHNFSYIIQVVYLRKSASVELTNEVRAAAVQYIREDSLNPMATLMANHC